MKAIVVTLGILLLLVGGGECRRCGTRQQISDWQKMRPKVHCMAPIDQLVPLPVPEGYDWVYPSVVLIKKCSGHMCIRRREKCVGTKSVNKTFAVEAHMMNSVEGSCDEVTVVEDLECGCRCMTGPEHCTKRQVFDNQMCQCQCMSELETMCRKRMLEHPNTYMWDPKTCTCPCNNTPEECPSGTHWVPEFCSCHKIMQ